MTTRLPLIVRDLWRYPVKSLQGERLIEADVERDGIVGDRGWSLVDEETGAHLTARREPQLLFASARLAGHRVADGVIVTLPDGQETNDDRQLSTWIGRPVRLQPASADVAGTFETQADENETGEWFQWTGPTGSFHDSAKAKISFTTEAELRHWDRRRFRINVILGGEASTEALLDGAAAGLVGGQVWLGSAQFDVIKQITRCVMTTRPQPPLYDDPAIERDLSVLKTINAENHGFLGVGALVRRPGTIRIGEVLR